MSSLAPGVWLAPCLRDAMSPPQCAGDVPCHWAMPVQVRAPWPCDCAGKCWASCARQCPASALDTSQPASHDSASASGMSAVSVDPPLALFSGSHCGPSLRRVLLVSSLRLPVCCVSLQLCLGRPHMSAEHVWHSLPEGAAGSFSLAVSVFGIPGSEGVGRLSLLPAHADTKGGHFLCV